jgi:hypothetical protein
MGTLRITREGSSELGDCERELNLEMGVFSARSGIETREAFVGVPDRMLVYRCAFTQPCPTVRVMLEPSQSVWSEDGSSLILIG